MKREYAKLRFTRIVFRLGYANVLKLGRRMVFHIYFRKIRAYFILTLLSRHGQRDLSQ